MADATQRAALEFGSKEVDSHFRPEIGPLQSLRDFECSRIALAQSVDNTIWSAPSPYAPFISSPHTETSSHARSVAQLHGRSGAGKPSEHLVVGLLQTRVPVFPFTERSSCRRIGSSRQRSNKAVLMGSFASFAATRQCSLSENRAPVEARQCPGP